MQILVFCGWNSIILCTFEETPTCQTSVATLSQSRYTLAPLSQWAPTSRSGHSPPLLSPSSLSANLEKPWVRHFESVGIKIVENRMYYLNLLEGNLECEGLIVIWIQRAFLDACLLLLQSFAVLHQCNFYVWICTEMMITIINWVIIYDEEWEKIMHLDFLKCTRKSSNVHLFKVFCFKNDLNDYA